MSDKSDRRPNLLFIIPDQHRWDFMPDAPESPLEMPTIQSLIRRGLRFNQAIVNTPLCAPCRASLASGRSYHSCGVMDNQQDLPSNQPTFYQKLKESGYRVAGVGKFDLHKSSSYWGLDGSESLSKWGFTDGIDNEGKWDGVFSGTETPQGPYMKMLHDRGLAKTHADDYASRGGRPGPGGITYKNTNPTPLPDDAYCDNWIAQNAISTLQALPKDTPWFMQVNFSGPHEPMDITESMHADCQGLEYPSPLATEPQPNSELNSIRQNYGAMLENIDQLTRQILDTLEDRGDLSNTIVVYSSDHGDMLGDHNEWSKSRPWQSSVAVPLVIAGPGIIQGQSDALVQLTDLAATFIDLAEAEELPNMDAQSIVPVLHGHTSKHRSMLHSGLRQSAGIARKYDGKAGWSPETVDAPSEKQWEMVWDGRYKVVIEQDQNPVMYDLLIDPDETQDVSHDRPDVYNDLTTAIKNEMTRVGAELPVSKDL